MMRVGTVSIGRSQPIDAATEFDVLWNSFGKNTGNLMFTEAMYRLIDADVVHLGFSFDPDVVNRTLDRVVIPAANWLSAGASWDWLVERIEKITVPVTLIGIGLQAETRDLDKVVVSDSAIRLVRLLSERSEAISVRGDFTRAWLASIGIGNAVTTGCPSIYMNAFPVANDRDMSVCVLQATRYFASRNFNAGKPVERHLFRSAAHLGLPMIYQYWTTAPARPCGTFTTCRPIPMWRRSLRRSARCSLI
jgi:hypothetical protein